MHKRDDTDNSVSGGVDEIAPHTAREGGTIADVNVRAFGRPEAGAGHVPKVDRNTPTARREDPDSASARLRLRDAPPTTPTRATLKRLHVLNTPALLRGAAQLGLATKRCDRCMHWSQEAARAAFKAFPHFALAAEHLSPARMGAAKAGEFDEIGQPVGHADTNLGWDQFGGCPKTGVITAATAVCDAWE